MKLKENVDLKVLEELGFRKHKKDSSEVLISKWTRNYIPPEYSEGYCIARGGFEFYPLCEIYHTKEIKFAYPWSWDKPKIEQLTKDLIEKGLVE